MERIPGIDEQEFKALLAEAQKITEEMNAETVRTRAIMEEMKAFEARVRASGASGDVSEDEKIAIFRELARLERELRASDKRFGTAKRAGAAVFRKLRARLAEGDRFVAEVAAALKQQEEIEKRGKRGGGPSAK